MARGLTSSERLGLEASAYEHCVDSGDAAVGRAHFKEIIKGQTPPWSPFQSFSPIQKMDHVADLLAMDGVPKSPTMRMTQH